MILGRKEKMDKNGSEIIRNQVIMMKLRESAMSMRVNLRKSASKRPMSFVGTEDIGVKM